MNALQAEAPLGASGHQVRVSEVERWAPDAAEDARTQLDPLGATILAHIDAVASP